MRTAAHPGLTAEARAYATDHDDAPANVVWTGGLPGRGVHLFVHSDGNVRMDRGEEADSRLPIRDRQQIVYAAAAIPKSLNKASMSIRSFS